MTNSNIKKFHSNLFFVSNLDNTVKFYENLGFEVSKSDETVRIKLDNFTLAFIDESNVGIDKEVGIIPKGIGVFTYVEVEDVDKQFEEVKGKGIKTSSEPKNYPWGKREFAVKDPDGYKIVFYSSII